MLRDPEYRSSAEGSVSEDAPEDSLSETPLAAFRQAGPAARGALGPRLPLSAVDRAPEVRPGG
jgi:hypothetical protein